MANLLFSQWFARNKEEFMRLFLMTLLAGTAFFTVQAEAKTLVFTHQYNCMNALQCDRYFYEDPKNVLMEQYDQGTAVSPGFNDGRNYVAEWGRIGIIEGRGVDRQGVPYVIVGPNFYHLSGWTKRDVAKVLDFNLKLTNNPARLYRLRDWDTGHIVGTYGEGGLILQ
tara:strand:+ start:814 stop:1317 length:504 start_codon:yes stop_codon:yes gene_type:complete